MAGSAPGAIISIAPRRKASPIQAERFTRRCGPGGAREIGQGRIAGPAFVAMTLQVSAITSRAAIVSGGEMRESSHEFEDTRRFLGRNGSLPGRGSGRLRQTYRSLGLWCALDFRS